MDLESADSGVSGPSPGPSPGPSSGPVLGLPSGLASRPIGSNVTEAPEEAGYGRSCNEPAHSAGTRELCRIYPDGFTVRRMTPADAKIVKDWWDVILAMSNDLEITTEIYGDETESVVGILDGEVVAAFAQTPLSSDILWGSHFYVVDKYRLRGYGQHVAFEVAHGLAGPDRIVCIHGLAYLRGVYERKGFAFAYHTAIYTGCVISRQIKTAKVAETNEQDAVTIHEFSSDLFEDLIRYDDECYVRASSPYRRALLERWTAFPGGGRTVVAFSEASVGGSGRRVVGYGCRRSTEWKGNHYTCIGPLYAESFDVARDLLAALTNDIEGQAIWMLVPVPNEEAIRLAVSLGLTAGEYMCRMSKNGVIPPPNPRVFAGTSIDTNGF